MLVSFIINIILISACLLVHYEILLRLSIYLPSLEIRPRIKVLWALLGVLFAHIIEVWVFAGGYYFFVELEKFGSLTGNIHHDIFDYVYYSFVTYTSLGLGDIIPIGYLRFLSGLEALTGLVLIAWSASFMYFQMERYWQES